MIDGLNLTKEYHSGSTIDEIMGAKHVGTEVWICSSTFRVLCIL